MKLDQQAITNLLTLVVFIAALIGWGMKMERDVNDNTASVDAFEQVQAVKWEAVERRLDNLTRDIHVLENRLRRDE